ncbi:MAG: fimbrial biogenesis outer membrane usher protein [Candidatus Eremiobacteraeota bacterium]|nr:fimbrial biogenesis outer membrane usher protein [Candidatus Eremiobacteraeota bacterium]
MRRIAAVLITSLILGRYASPASAAPQRAMLTMTVNSVDKGMHIVQVDGDDVLVSRNDVADLGLSKVPGTDRGTSAFISLASLAPALKFTVDEKTLTVAMTVAAQYLGDTTVSLTDSSAIAAERTSSAFVNYAVSKGTQSPVTLSGEFGSTVAQGLLYASFSKSSSGFVPGLINWTTDSQTKLRRIIIGDGSTTAGDLGGSTLIRGVTVQRDWQLNSRFNRQVSTSLNGIVESPSTASIYVNGLLVGTQELPPGAFNLSNIPLISGSNDVQVVIRDAFGHEQVIRRTFYHSLESLNPGLSDYSFALGFERNGLSGTNGSGNGPLAFVGHYVRGLTGTFTGGADMSFAQGAVNAGPSFVFATRLGQFTSEAQVSHAAGAGGFAGLVAYDYSGRSLGFNGELMMETPQYSSVSLLPGEDRMLFRASGGVSVPLGKQRMIEFRFSKGRDRDHGTSTEFDTGTSVRIARRLSLALAYRLQNGYGGGGSGFVTTLSMPFGGDGELTSTTGNATGTSVSAGRSARADQPLGYDVMYSRQSDQSQLGYDLEYYGAHGLYSAQRITAGGETSTELSASGSVVYIDRGMYFSRPVQDAYVLVDASLPGVVVDENNQPMGKTDRNGKLFLPDAVSYYQNEVRLNSSNAPMNYSFDKTLDRVTPSYRGGAVAHFALHRTQSFLGTLIVHTASKAVAPAYGQLTLELANGKTARSDIGENGEFYLENVAPGTYPAKIEYKDGLCSMKMTIPNVAQPYVRMGTVRCDGSR